MGEVDIVRQSPNVARMKMLGAEVRPAKSGSKTLKDATNEAIRDWINNPLDTHYIIGSVVGPHPYPDMVARFQSVISKEVKEQLLKFEKTKNNSAILSSEGVSSQTIQGRVLKTAALNEVPKKNEGSAILIQLGAFRDSPLKIASRAWDDIFQLHGDIIGRKKAIIVKAIQCC